MNDSPKARERFEVILLDQGGEAPTTNRLRSALKALLRRFGFKCETIRQLKDEDGADVAQEDGR